MLPLSKFAFLPEKINIDVAKSGGKGTIHMKCLNNLCKRTLHTIQYVYDPVFIGAARRSSKRNPSDDIDQVREIVRQYNRDSQW